MHSVVDQQVDEKIHQFLERKSPLKTLSKSIAERLVPPVTKRRKAGISYEPMRWHQGSAHNAH
ncbi:MAG: hypothetical protein JWO07_269 [Candidatus Saccharibacteria bacterium]|nr:hypothetical protein [Candidatus Saccharibacteria bacterium]